MIKDTIKSRWNKLLDKGFIHYHPKQNSKLVLAEGKFPLRIDYVPERAKRLVTGKKSTTPLGTDLIGREDCLYVFDELVLLANNRPIDRYHSILCSKNYMPQNEFSNREIREVSQIVENTGIRSFLNMIGAAATLNHFHTQVLFDKLNVEELDKVYITENIGFLPDYPGGNILITGNLNKRSELLWHMVESLSMSSLPRTIRNDGSISDQHVYTLIFWDNYILMIPRKKETPSFTGAMAGGLELSGYFLITQPMTVNSTFEGVNYHKMLSTIQEVTFSKQDIDFLYPQIVDKVNKMTGF